MAERQTCGRRMRDWGPWKQEEGLDTWETNRWADTQEEADRRAAEAMAEAAGKYKLTPADTLWRGPGPAPRTCSFCGGVNPDDAIALVRDHGWEVEATGKNYKRYLHPPGYRGWRDRWTQASRDARKEGLMGDALLDAVRERAGRCPWSPVPPVKLYVQHFDEDQIERFNAALRESRESPDA